ncbi:unnamed protein product [Phaedon cochleariae]|uniref:Zinc finger PHD-type domain-containing protein n=1 Tax=Phaedon cochleariae TaxID=80249 RepID=A0A9N9SLS0_PHACE|nr:unnamed protein product [Phaedon cochleariae]
MIDPADRGVLRCSGCQTRWHGVCARPQPPDMNEHTMVNWLCETCDDNAARRPIAKNDSETQRFNAIMQQLSVITESMATCNGQIEELKIQMNSQSQIINNCVTDITTLRNDNEKLRSKISELENKVSVNSIPNEETQRELLERIRRGKNILILGAPDDGKRESDIQLANAIVQHLSPGITIVSCYRIGKPRTDEKPNPLKISLSSTEDAIQILKNRNKLCRNMFPDIGIRADLTPSQSTHLDNLRKELQRRTANGERNLTIKYVKSVPKIVSTDNPTTSKRTRENDDSPKRSDDLMQLHVLY